MDEVRKRKPPRAAIAVGLAVVALLTLIVAFARGFEGVAVPLGSVDIAQVDQGVFQDFTVVRARAEPRTLVYLESLQGGRVEQILAQDGDWVEEGQPLATLINQDLQIEILARESEVAQQRANLASFQASYVFNSSAQDATVLAARGQADTAALAYRRKVVMVERQLALPTYVDAEKLAVEQSQRQLENAVASQQRQRDLQASMTEQLAGAVAQLEKGLALARSNLDALVLRAPISGRMTGFQVERGQTLSVGARYGQLDGGDGYKLRADLDEYFLDRIQVGQTGKAQLPQGEMAVTVRRILPQVREGRFEVEFDLKTPEVQGLRTGQTVETSLTMGESRPAHLIPNAAFMTDTGGSWVFVVDSDGRTARRRPIETGGRTPQTVEVLSGLRAGEKIVTSSYAAWADADVIRLTR